MSWIHDDSQPRRTMPNRHELLIEARLLKIGYTPHQIAQMMRERSQTHYSVHQTPGHMSGQGLHGRTVNLTQRPARRKRRPVDLFKSLDLVTRLRRRRQSMKPQNGG